MLLGGAAKYDELDDDTKQKAQEIQFKTVNRTQMLSKKLDSALTMQDAGFYALLDSALEEACAVPTKKPSHNDLDLFKLPSIGQQSATPLEGKKPQQVPLGIGTAPQNV